ncbi:MAG: DUF6331 family protein [Polyangiales bacterium]
MLTPDWLVEDRRADCFFGDCETMCVAGCCGLSAFALPNDVESLVSMEYGGLILTAQDLCYVRRRIAAMRRALSACEQAISSDRFNAGWRSGREAAEWFLQWEEWIARVLDS